jgi:hypothetical protein
VLDTAAHPGAGRVPAGDVRRHRLAARFGTPELLAEATLLDQRQIRAAAIGRVGPDVACCVGGIETIKADGEMETELVGLREELAGARAAILAMRESTSWRISAPVRVLGRDAPATMTARTLIGS